MPPWRRRSTSSAVQCKRSAVQLQMRSQSSTQGSGLFGRRGVQGLWRGEGKPARARARASIPSRMEASFGGRMENGCVVCRGGLFCDGSGLCEAEAKLKLSSDPSHSQHAIGAEDGTPCLFRISPLRRASVSASTSAAAIEF
jgi:hypothetical protein